MIRFGDIRQILDKYTVDCKQCPYQNNEQEPDEDGIVPYESCNLDCDSYWVKQVKKEILALLDKEEVKTDPISMIPCKIIFKGSCQKLPEKAEDGDSYVILEHKLENGYGWQDQRVFYWYDNKWNYIPNAPEYCRIKYV